MTKTLNTVGRNAVSRCLLAVVLVVAASCRETVVLGQFDVGTDGEDTESDFPPEDEIETAGTVDEARICWVQPGQVLDSAKGTDPSDNWRFFAKTTQVQFAKRDDGSIFIATPESIALYRSTGEQVWKTPFAPDGGYPSAILPHADGALVTLGGRIPDSSMPTESKPQQELHRFDEYGRHLWSTPIPGGRVTLIPPHTIAVAGSFTNRLFLGKNRSKVLQSDRNGVTGYLAFFDPDGNALNAYVLDTAIEPHDLLLRPDGTILIVGALKIDNVDYGAHAVKLDQKGSQFSLFKAAYASNNYRLQLFKGPANSVFLAGHFDERIHLYDPYGSHHRFDAAVYPGSHQFDSYYFANYLLTRYTPIGEIDWAFAGASDNAKNREEIGVNGIALDSEYNLFLVGVAHGEVLFGQGQPGEAILDSNGESTGYVARFKPDGSFDRAGRLTIETSAAPVQHAGIIPNSDGSAVLISKLFGTAQLRLVDGTESVFSSPATREQLFLIGLCADPPIIRDDRISPIETEELIHGRVSRTHLDKRHIP